MTSSNPDVFGWVNQIVSNSQVLDAPRAVLLLRVCQAARVFQPDKFDGYWQQLQKLASKLPGTEYPKEYQTLLREVNTQKGSIAAPQEKTSAKPGKFAQEIIDLVNAAMQQASTNPDEAKRMLRSAEETLKKRFWPFGKEPAKQAVVEAWSELDRDETIKHLGQVPAVHQHYLLDKLNRQSPLTVEEWEQTARLLHNDTLCKQMALDILSRDKPILTLPPRIAHQIVNTQMEEYFKLVVADESSSKDAREKIWQGLLKLALTYLDNEPVHAEGLLERMYTITSTSVTFGEKWPLRMSMMANVLLVWSEFIPLREKALAYLHKEAPTHWHDFSLAYWLACLPATDEEVDPAWNQVLSLCKDAPLSQAWFLTTLLRRGKEDAAFRLARLSPNADALLKRLRRGLLLMGSARAAELIQKEDMAEDPLGLFLLLPGVDERVAYLREQTANGTKPLPAKLWSAPNIMEFLQTSSTDPSQGGMLVLYTRTEKPENMFKEYLRMHAFGQYNYEDFDPNLLAVLVAWDDAYPEEFKQETELMWKAMKPESWMYRLDLVRNAVFTRCQTAMAARPDMLNRLFVSWVKQTLVDKQYQETVGNTTYTFSLRDIVPFLYMVLAAQKVARYSSKRCDDILTIAIRDYTASDDLMTAAGEMYASDKDPQGVHPPSILKNKAQMQAWQLGAIQAIWRRLLPVMLEAALTPKEEPTV